MAPSRSCQTARKHFDRPLQEPVKQFIKLAAKGTPVCRLRYVCFALVTLSLTRPAAAQQRPLSTEDPEPIGAGRVLIEGGIDYAHDQHFPVSGLEGNLWRLPILGTSVRISPIAELQF